MQDDRHSSHVWHVLWMRKSAFEQAASSGGDRVGQGEGAGVVAGGLGGVRGGGGVAARQEKLVTVGHDGRVMQWTYSKGVIEYETLTRLGIKTLTV